MGLQLLHVQFCSYITVTQLNQELEFTTYCKIVKRVVRLT